MSNIAFTKIQGAGNDFVLVAPGATDYDWPEMAQAMCDRHFGIGADGLLLVLPSVSANCKMRIFNIDGSEAQACGNGLRCTIKYVIEKGMVAARASGMTVETVSGTRQARLYYEHDDIKKIQIGMGKPEFRAADIPVIIDKAEHGQVDTKAITEYNITVDGEELSLGFVSMGNPHAVHFCSYAVSYFPLSQVGPEVEHLEIFPRRINFEVARIIDRGNIEARVWERGVGETLACGSGACAIAVTAQLKGYVDNNVNVRLPGGTLELEWNGSGEVYLSGPAEIVFTGDWPL